MYIFAQMMHEGEIVRVLIGQLGISVKVLAAKAQVHRNTIGNWLSSATIDTDKLILLGKALRYDLRVKIPRLKQNPDSEELSFFNEDPAPYFKEVHEVKQLIDDERQHNADFQFQIKMLQEKIKDMEEIIAAKTKLNNYYERIIEKIDAENEGQKLEGKTA